MEKETVKLLAIQMEGLIGDFNSNIKETRDLLTANLEKYSNIDFVFLPEVWTVGWHPPVFEESAETIENSQAVNMLSQIAALYNVNVIGGSFIRLGEDGKLYNTCPAINRQGKLVATYDKNHLFSYYGDNEGDYITKGKNPVMVELDGIKIGLTICYDIRFPEIYRAYRKAGADILVNMAAWPKSRKIHWDSLTTARAVENQSYMVALTQTGLLADGSENLGHSMIIDYEGKIMDEIQDLEGAIYAEVNLNRMYDFREKCTVLKDICKSYEVEIK